MNQESKKSEPEKNRQIRTHYDNLKVARNAPDALIKAAYKVLLQQHHPDKVEVAKQAEALRITQIIRSSYDVLSDPVQRAEHDAWIKSRSHKPDVDVNAREKAEAEKQRQARKNEDLRREQETRDKEDLKRREAQRAYDKIQKRQAQAQEKEAENKTGCLPWIIGFAVIYVLIVATGTNTESVSQAGSVTKESVKPIVIKRETPNGYTKANRYHDNGNGTVTDLETNLEWMRCSLGQNLTSLTCEGQAKMYSWNDALTFGENFKFAGHSDWRVPTIDDLKTLIYCSSDQPQTWNDTGNKCEENYETPVVSEAFPNTPVSFFWSSSPSAINSGVAWVVGFDNGNSSNGYKSGSNYVRLVR